MRPRTHLRRFPANRRLCVLSDNLILVDLDMRLVFCISRAAQGCCPASAHSLYQSCMGIAACTFWPYATTSFLITIDQIWTVI